MLHTLHDSRIITPSFASGYARHPGEAAHPHLWRGLIGCWAPFLGPQPSRLWDMSGRGNHGTLVTLTADDWVPGPRGWALRFGATGDRVECGIGLVDMHKAYSVVICATIDSVAATTNYVLAGFTPPNGTATQYLIFIHRNDRTGMALQWRKSGTVSIAPATTRTPDLVPHRWHTVGFSRRDGTSSIPLRIYQDGVTRLDTLVLMSLAATTTQEFVIGNWDTTANSTLYWRGKIDSVYLYDWYIPQIYYQQYNAGMTPLHLATREAVSKPFAPTPGFSGEGDLLLLGVGG